MGFKETTVSSSLAILATFLLLSVAAAAASFENGVSPLCASADNKELCSNMTKGANNWPEAMTNMINATIEKVEAAKEVAYGVGAKLPRNLLPDSKNSIDSTCKEAFDTLISNLQECREFVKDDPTSALKFYLPSVSFFDCKNALEEFDISVPEVTKFYDELTGMSTNLIAVMQKNQAYV